ncbi:dCMP deaminase [Chiua virens]|nr:dCMP deaminase [Chiua virens]
MFIAIIGTQCAGKSTVEDYLISKGFTSVRISRTDPLEASRLHLCHFGIIVNPASVCVASPRVATQPASLSQIPELPNPPETSERDSFLNMNSPSVPVFPNLISHPVTFASPEELLDHVTRHWRENFVTIDLTSSMFVGLFAKRPFFLLVNVNAPLLQRYHRRLQGLGSPLLEEFVRQDDEHVFGTDTDNSTLRANQSLMPGLRGMHHLVKLNVTNTFHSLSEFRGYLDSLDITNTERLRPRWDTYFMAWEVPLTILY